MNVWSVCFVAVILLPTIYGITVITPVGDVIGVEKTLDIDGTPRRISVFSGIPYAESTAGANRFRKPIPKAPFRIPFNAAEVPVGCRPMSKIYERNGLRYSEDCLVMNVHVPSQSDQTAQLPVMVWFYGGGFNQGSIAMYPADVLSAFGDVVVVTVNYRLGPFGFLRSSDGQLIGNQGLWDQHLALRWVHDNIVAFSGNPSEVTIFGESAGAISVSLQALYPGNRGLFQRVIAESGTAVADWSFYDRIDTHDYLVWTGCGTDITCLQSLPAERLMTDTVSGNIADNFKPTIDNDFFVDTPYNIIFGKGSRSESARNFFASLDFVTGVNSFEGAIFIAVIQQLLRTRDFHNLTITPLQFSDTIIPYIVEQYMDVKDTSSLAAGTSLLNFEYTDWTQPDDVQWPRLAVVELISDFSFFYPALQTVAAHLSLTHRPHATYLYEFAVQPRK